MDRLQSTGWNTKRLDYRQQGMAHTKTWSGVRPRCRTPCLCTWARGFRMAFPCWTRVASEGPRYPLAMQPLLPHACRLSSHKHQHQYFYRGVEVNEKMQTCVRLTIAGVHICNYRFYAADMSGSGLTISCTAASFIASTYATSQQ